MAVISGKTMAVTGEASIDMFQIEVEDLLVPYTAGNHQGGVDRVDGNTDWKGVYRLYGHTPLRFPNDSFTFVCSPIQTGSKAVSGTARCTKLEIIWDIANGRYIESWVHFGANGALSEGQTDPTDVTIPGALTSKSMTVDWGGADVANVAYMKLVFTSDGIEYVDSDTDGQTQRTEEDVDCMAFWIVNDDDSGNFPTRGEQQIAKFFVTPASASWWEVKWMRIRGTKPWKADRRGKRKPVQRITVAEGSLSDGSAVGYIKNPAVATKWP